MLPKRMPTRSRANFEGRKMSDQTDDVNEFFYHDWLTFEPIRNRHFDPSFLQNGFSFPWMGKNGFELFMGLKGMVVPTFFAVVSS